MKKKEYLTTENVGSICIHTPEMDSICDFWKDDEDRSEPFRLSEIALDSFNTANKCGLLPSELFQWKHETLMLLKEIANDTERRYRFTSGANWPKWYDKAINQIEQ